MLIIAAAQTVNTVADTMDIRYMIIIFTASVLPTIYLRFVKILQNKIYFQKKYKNLITFLWLCVCV